MALTTIPSNPASQKPTLEAVKSAVKELQRIKQVVVDGAAANTNIAVAGIATADVIVSAIEFASGVPTARVASVTSAGNIQVTTVTTGSKLLVTYFDVA